MKKSVAAVAFATVLLLSGCKNYAQVASISPGVQHISESMYGVWSSPGGKGCHWKKIDKHGNVTSQSTKTVSMKGIPLSQGVMFGTTDLNGTFRSDKCGAWTH